MLITQITRTGITPGPRLLVCRSVGSPLRRRRRPRLDQSVVVDGFALRLLVSQLALGRDRAVLLGLGEPELSRLLRIELRSAGTLYARLLDTFHHRVLRCRKRVHRSLWRLCTRRRIADVLPPQLGKLRIIRNVVSGRGPVPVVNQIRTYW